jgi:hypothetical protein
MWLLGALALSPLVGCNHFQTLETSKWLDVGYFDSSSNRASHILAFWDSQVRLTQDSSNGGRPLAGMAGRLYLLNQETGKPVDATGRVVVQMHDMTNVQPGQPTHCIAEYTFDPVSLKRLKRPDGIAEGYTLFLPWESYRPDVRRIEIRVAYVPDEKQNPFFAEPSLITLQTADQPPPVIQGHLVPAAPSVIPVSKR